MHRFYQFQWKTVILFIGNFSQRWDIYCTNRKPPVRVNKRRKVYRPKQLSITSLQTYYLNIESSSRSDRNNKRENIVQTKLNFCGGTNNSAEKC